MEKYLLPLALSTIAGLSTVLGGMITFFIKKDSVKVLSLGLGFSAGVMILVSLFEFLPEARHYVVESFGADKSWIALLSFAVGILIAVLIDRFIPDHIDSDSFEDDSKSKDAPLFKASHPCDCKHASFIRTPKELNKLKKASLLTAITVAVHNFPEGLATFFAASTDITLGITVVVAIAIHNIPEGIAIALPVYQATGSKSKSLFYTFLSGMAEPLGGILGFVLITLLFHDVAIGLMFGAIAGIMTYISFDTLLPLAKEYDTGHYSITGVVLGMLLMATVLFCF